MKYDNPMILRFHLMLILGQKANALIHLYSQAGYFTSPCSRPLEHGWSVLFGIARDPITFVENPVLIELEIEKNEDGHTFQVNLHVCTNPGAPAPAMLGRTIYQDISGTFRDLDSVLRTATPAHLRDAIEKDLEAVLPPADPKHWTPKKAKTAP